MNYPTLYITYAYPLDNRQRRLFESKNFGYYPPFEKVKEKTIAWRELWEKINNNNKIFELLTKYTGVSYSRDLELYVYGRGLSPMSAPLMMPMVGPNEKEFSDDDFIETVIHEIAHNYVNDWRKYPNTEKYWEYVREHYKEESISTQNHIVIYAILTLVLEEAFGKEKMNDFLKPPDEDYEKALMIARKEGAENILTKYKKFLQ